MEHTPLIKVKEDERRDEREDGEKRRKEKKKEKKKKVKRGKKIKRKLEKCKVLYANVRGLKSKQLSLEEIIIEENPTIITLVETGLENKEEAKFEGYEVYHKNKTEDGEGRGILIAVKEELKNITTMIKECEKPAEQLWVRITNGRSNIRV